MFRVFESKPIMFLIYQNISADLKGPKVKYKLHYSRCTGRFLGPPHDTTPAAVTTNKHIKMSSFKRGKNIQKKEVGPDRSVSDNQSSSVTLNKLATKARKPYIWYILLTTKIFTKAAKNGVKK